MQANSNELHLVDKDGEDAIRGTVKPLDRSILARAKVAYAARRADLDLAQTLVIGPIRPRAGEVLLARVETIGQHGRIELANGRRAHLYPGDEIVVCYGNRYAPDQFHAVVPATLEACHLVAAGGIASSVLARHAGIKPATVIRPLGLLGDETGEPLDLSDFALPRSSPKGARPPTTAVVGTSMNAGKTTAAANLVRGLVSAGLRVGAAKITGTGAGCDTWRMLDAGAAPVVDFTDFGYCSTYCVAASEIEGIMSGITDHLHAGGVDAVVIELADGLYQTETARLLSSATFARRVDSIVFAACDAMSAVAGVAWLLERELPLRAVSGVITRSPLGSNEAEQLLPAPVVRAEQLSEPCFATAVNGVPVGQAIERRTA